MPPPARAPGGRLPSAPPRPSSRPARRTYSLKRCAGGGGSAAAPRVPVGSALGVGPARAPAAGVVVPAAAAAETQGAPPLRAPAPLILFPCPHPFARPSPPWSQVLEGREWDEVDWKRHGLFCSFGLFYLVRRGAGGGTVSRLGAGALGAAPGQGRRSWQRGRRAPLRTAPASTLTPPKPPSRPLSTPHPPSKPARAVSSTTCTTTCSSSGAPASPRRSATAGRRRSRRSSTRRSSERAAGGGVQRLGSEPPCAAAAAAAAAAAHSAPAPRRALQCRRHAYCLPTHTPPPPRCPPATPSATSRPSTCSRAPSRAALWRPPWRSTGPSCGTTAARCGRSGCPRSCSTLPSSPATCASPTVRRARARGWPGLETVPGAAGRKVLGAVASS
jgi:hypothetical protein